MDNPSKRTLNLILQEDWKRIIGTHPNVQAWTTMLTADIDNDKGDGRSVCSIVTTFKDPSL